jgi:transposase
MEVLHDRVAGLDVHKQTVVACVRTPGPGQTRRAETREFETFIDDLERLRAWLVAEGVSHVAMEATGIYWKPVWFVLEDASFELLLANARNMRMVPGRKTDVADAGWIAQLLECGLLGASLVPPPVIRDLRDLTRYRKRLVQDRTARASGSRRCASRSRSSSGPWSDASVRTAPPWSGCISITSIISMR